MIPKRCSRFIRTFSAGSSTNLKAARSRYWLVTTGDDGEPGINGGVTRPREGQSPGTLNTIAVSSLDQTIKNVEERGGKICVPKMAIPKVGWLAYAADPAGNVFGIIEPDTNAK